MYISVFAHTYISVSVLVRPGGYRGQQFPGLGARVEEVFRFQLNGYELLRSIVTNAREYPRLGFFEIGLCVWVPCLGTECLKSLDGFKGALLRGLGLRSQDSKLALESGNPIFVIRVVRGGASA